MALAKKSKTTKILLVTYIVLSAIFILITMFNYLKVNVYMAGYQNAVNGVISEALNKECKPITLFSGKTQVALINVACLQQPSQAQEGVGQLEETSSKN